ncbi:hypothetical protein ACTQ5X_07495 [Jeotgalibaca porci]|uniref:hypothetical protein n=1 Tax=Jeotgalibaca porci TaxID=1868793 RepID=UPI003F9029E4
MSVNESGLNRTTKKDTQLQTKLINLRKKRDAAVKKVERISNKNKITSGEIRRFNQHRKDLTTIESNIVFCKMKVQKFATQ